MLDYVHCTTLQLYIILHISSLVPFKVADYLQQYTAWRPPTCSNYLVPHFNASLKILLVISLGAPLLAAPLWTPCTSRDVLVKCSLLQLTEPIDIYTLIHMIMGIGHALIKSLYETKLDTAIWAKNTPVINLLHIKIEIHAKF